jgi:hypothetical protein
MGGFLMDGIQIGNLEQKASVPYILTKVKKSKNRLSTQKRSAGEISEILPI